MTQPGVAPIVSLANLLDRHLTGHPAGENRQRLFETLHTQPLSLLIGSVCGVATAWACALLTGRRLLLGLAIGLTLVAAARCALSWWLHRHPTRQADGWLGVYYPIVAFFYATLTGMIAAAAILADAATDVQLIAVAHALGYCGGITVRSAGRPVVAIGQMTMTMLPLIIACVAKATPALLLLAAMLPCFAFGMAVVTLTIFRHLAEEMNAADDRLLHARELREQSRTDAVTGFVNRAGFDDAFAALKADLPASRKIVLMSLDLARIKDINDSLGHVAGDKALVDVAQRLRRLMPGNGVLARFGGGEFMLGACVDDREEAEGLVSAIDEALVRPIHIGGERAESGVAIGAAVLPDDATGQDKLMRAADLALFHAKASETDRHCFYDKSMTQAQVREKEIEDELRAAIQKDELSIYFQPIVDLATGRIRTFEALVRWFHPEKGELFPNEFIPVAEKTGLIITLGNWITAQAARAAATWPEDVTLAVNLSPAQIKAPGAALGLLNALREAKLDPARLELEVTESLFEEDNADITQFMVEMTREGVRFALDDFGAGSSSLHYISRYPFRTIKVDRSFVSGPQTGRRTDAVIRAVAEMGATLDMEIVAEGLETIEQVQAVRKAGCTRGQGYYFSRAVPDYLAVMLLAQEAQDPEGGFPLVGDDRLAS